jgi:hypothetical protein
MTVADVASKAALMPIPASSDKFLSFKYIEPTPKTTFSWHCFSFTIIWHEVHRYSIFCKLTKIT